MNIVKWQERRRETMLKHILEKAIEHSRQFHEFIRNKLLVREQVIRWNDSEEGIIEVEKDICKEQNAKFLNAYC